MDQELRALERAVAENPDDFDAKLALFNAQIRISPTGLEVSYKIRNKKTGRFVSNFDYGRVNFSKNGKSWKTKDGLFEFISKLPDPSGLVDCELIEFRILESVIDNFDKLILDAKIRQLEAKKAALDRQQQELLKEFQKAKAP